MLSSGQLVKIAGTSTGTGIDGIVLETRSATKVVVAVMDRKRGPVFRTVHPKTLMIRDEQGPDDRMLQLLVRRTPLTTPGDRGATVGRQDRSGFTRGTAHRPTGR